MSGFSPTARSRRPKRVWNSKPHTKATHSSARYTKALCPMSPKPKMGPTRGSACTACAASVNQPVRRAPSPTCGVCPPIPNQAPPSTTVRPAAVMVKAMPITTWSPRWVTQPQPCTMDIDTPKTKATIMAGTHDPVAAATLAAAKADSSILPSRPRSTTPDRSARHPAKAHRISGVAPRSVDPSSVPTRMPKSCSASISGSLRRHHRPHPGTGGPPSVDASAPRAPPAPLTRHPRTTRSGPAA